MIEPIIQIKEVIVKDSVEVAKLEKELQSVREREKTFIQELGELRR